MASLISGSTVAQAAGPSHDRTFDLARQSVRELNRFLHRELADSGVLHVTVQNPDGAHSVAVGVDAPIDIDVEGHVLWGMTLRLLDDLVPRLLASEWVV